MVLWLKQSVSAIHADKNELFFGWNNFLGA